MKKANGILIGVAAVLLLLSLTAYHYRHSQAERFDRGRRLFQSLDPDEVETIVVSKGDETVTLKRKGEEYVVEEAHGYPAKNEAVNRLFKTLFEITLEKEVGSGEKLAKELALQPPGEETTELVLKNAAQKEMVHLRLGKTFEGGGRYLQRLDQDRAPILLSGKGVPINADRKTYLKTEILSVSQPDIEVIEGPDFEIAAGEDGALRLAGIPGGKEEDPSAMGRAKGAFTRLVFEEIHLADADVVRDLTFRDALRVTLKDGTGYGVQLAEKGDAVYLRISGSAAVEKVEIARDTPEEELQEKADLLTRADEIKAFNAFHGSWVYKITSFVADKFQLKKADLMKDKE